LLNDSSVGQSSQVHVIAIAPEPTTGAAYRAELPMRALGGHGHLTEFRIWDQRDEPPPLEHLREADVVHMWRLFRAPARRLAAALREAGVAVVFDNDDDMTRVPKGSPAYREMKAAREIVASELSAMLRLADLVSTTCGELAGRLRRQGASNTRVVENYVETGFVRERNGAHGGVTIGWVAGMEHRGDLKDLRLRRTLEALLEQHPHVSLVGVGLDLGVQSDRYTHRADVPFPELPDAIAQFDLALAPIADVSFNRVRSNIKVKEYAAGGVPWLASPIGPYRGLGEEQGGRLVPDYGWSDALTDLVTDAEARAALAEQAAAWGRTQTVVGNVGEWEAVFAEAAERAGRTVSIPDAGRDAPAPAGVGGGARGRTIVPRPLAPPEAPPAAGDGAAAKARRGLFRRRASR
jgi:glycosyltransferase involved in cell wall biosynthesis